MKTYFAETTGRPLNEDNDPEYKVTSSSSELVAGGLSHQEAVELMLQLNQEEKRKYGKEESK